MTSRLVAAREAILAAAEARVADDGWRGLTIAGVAGDAGVAVGTVYRHVADKDALCAEAFDRAAARELTAVRTAAHAAATPLAGCEAALRSFAGRALRAPRLAHALLTEPAPMGVEERRLAFRRDYRRLFAGLVRDAIRAGELTQVDAESAAAVLVGGLAEGLVGPIAPAREAAGAGRDEVVDALVAACLRSLPRPDTPPRSPGAFPVTTPETTSRQDAP